MSHPRKLINSFSGTLAAVILALLLISLLALSTYWYFGERDKVNRDFVDKKNMTDEMLQQSVIWIDRGVVLFEMAYDPGLKNGMTLYQQAYTESGGDINSLKLSSLKKQLSEELNGEWDLYLIDNGVVIKTTFANDSGLDFKKYPSLYKKYTDYVREGELIIDRTVKGFSPGAPIRKFAYQGTFDHRYLLEISRNFNNFHPDESKASYKELINTTVRLNPYIQSIEIYNSQYTIIANNTSGSFTLSPDPDILKSVKKTFSSRNESVLILPDENIITGYLFLPVEDTGAPSTPMMHLVARIVYSTELLNRLNFQLTLLYLCLIGSTVLIAFLVAVALSRHLTKPLNLIGDDVDRIASGDLEHQISRTGALETQRIERSISQMVANLKENIENLRLRECELNQELLLRKKAEERYRRLFDSAHEAIFILERGLIRDCNQEVFSLLGRDRSDIIGRHLSVFSPGYSDLEEELSRLFASSIPHECSDSSIGLSHEVDSTHERCHKRLKDMNDEETFFTKWVLVKSDGSLIETEVHLNSVTLGDTVIIQAMVRDVTELNEMYCREVRAIAQIEENLAQLAAINDQIRNPLAIISTLSEMQGGEYVLEIENQVNRIDILINEVDQRFVATDKVRMYLRKHYEVGYVTDSNLNGLVQNP